MKRVLGSVMTVLGVIDSSAVRHYNEDGSFDYATFSFNCNDYIMKSDGTLLERGCFDNSFNVVSPSWCKGGIYPQVCINGCYIKSYVLSLTLANKDFYNYYMSDGSLVVNHTVTEFNGKLFDGKYKYRSVAIPMKSVAYNPEYLEVISRSDNIKHGKFIEKYGLYGVYVSAKDLVSLSKLVIDPDSVDTEDRDIVIDYNKSIVVQYYTEKGLSINLQPAA